MDHAAMGSPGYGGHGLTCRLRRQRVQSSGSSANLRLVALYHPIPEMGCLHLPFIALRASSWVWSPPATTSFRCLSCAFMTSSAVIPLLGRSQGPPSSLHVIVFIGPSSVGRCSH